MSYTADARTDHLGLTVKSSDSFGSNVRVGLGGHGHYDIKEIKTKIKTNVIGEPIKFCCLSGNGLLEFMVKKELTDLKIDDNFLLFRKGYTKKVKNNKGYIDVFVATKYYFCLNGKNVELFVYAGRLFITINDKKVNNLSTVKNSNA